MARSASLSKPSAIKARTKGMLQKTKPLGSRTAVARPENAVYPFDATLSLEELAKLQGISSAPRFEHLRGEFWPENETVEEFLDWLHRLRHGQRCVSDR